MTQLPFKSATELAAAVRAKEISSIELLDCYLDRIEEFNPGLGAVVTLDAERARHEAAEADRRLALPGSSSRIRLVVSGRTVDHHVPAILRKLGASACTASATVTITEPASTTATPSSNRCAASAPAVPARTRHRRVRRRRPSPR
jgi:hypothetical protein